MEFILIYGRELRSCFDNGKKGGVIGRLALLRVLKHLYSSSDACFLNCEHNHLESCRLQLILLQVFVKVLKKLSVPVA
jgi:hypothetical protein